MASIPPHKLNMYAPRPMGSRFRRLRTGKNRLARPFAHPVNEYDKMTIPGRSEQPFSVDNSLDKEAVIRAVTFVDDSLEEMYVSKVHLGLPPNTKAIAPPTAGLGQLFFDKLPAEIAWSILAELDLASLDSLRQVNRRARELVLGLPELRAVAKFAGKTLLALVATGLAPHFTISNVKAALQTENCRCGEFATLVFLPALRKGCLRCIDWPQDRSRSRVFRLWQVGEEARKVLTDENMHLAEGSQHRILHALPGPYAKTAFSSNPHEMKRAVQERGFYVASTFPRILSWERTPAVGIQSSTAATTMPYVHGSLTSSPRVWSGVRCRGCVNLDAKIPRPRFRGFDDLLGRFYSFDGYFEHFRWCLEAQQIWHDTVSVQGLEGTIKPDFPLPPPLPGSLEEPRQHPQQRPSPPPSDSSHRQPSY